MNIKKTEEDYKKHKNINVLQEILEQNRQLLQGFEEHELIEDDKTLKTNSQKAISYRRSASYLLLKQLRMIIDGHKCSKCGSVDGLHLHHVHYKNYFKEHLQDVKILCTICHQIGHEAKSNIYKNQKGLKMDTSKKLQELRNLKAHRKMCTDWLTSYCAFKNSGSKDAASDADKEIGRMYNQHITTVNQIRKSCGLSSRQYQNSQYETFFGLGGFASRCSGLNKDQTMTYIDVEFDRLLKNQATSSTNQATSSTKPATNSTGIFVENQAARTAYLSEIKNRISQNKMGLSELPNDLLLALVK